jgi:hypothetical protein
MSISALNREKTTISPAMLRSTASEGQLTGLVKAIMRDKVYPVLVSVAIKSSLTILSIQCVK